MSRLLQVLVTTAVALLPVCLAQTFTTIDYPGAQNTWARGINRQGDVVGDYQDAQGNYHGFVWSNGNWRSFDCPGATAIRGRAINSGREIVGNYRDAAGRYHGYYMGEPGGQCFALDPKGGTGASVSAGAQGINDAGEIVGQYIDSDGNWHGYLMRGPVFLVFDVIWDARWNGGLAINSQGDIAGHVQVLGEPMKGILLTKNSLSIFEVPPEGAGGMSCGLGINARREIVGHDQKTGGPLRGYLLSAGTFLTIEYLGAASTETWGINDDGLIVGFYTDSNQKAHGFLLRR